jgi:hypothetical protein
MVSDTDGWAVGDAGTIVRWNGAAWAAETSPASIATISLNGVLALNDTDVWAVGNSGTILHRNGLGWTLVPSGVTENLNSLYMLSDNEGWAVGASDGTSPVILFWDGSTWTRVFPIPMVNLDLLSIWMVASQDGWSVGQDGLILSCGPAVTLATTTITVPVTTTSTTTNSVTATSTLTTSTVPTQITSTQTVSTTATTTILVVSTGTVTPVPSPVPGFPFESILLGLVAGAVALFVIRGRRHDDMRC